MFVYYDECLTAYLAALRKYWGLSYNERPDNLVSAYLDKLKPQKLLLIAVAGLSCAGLEENLDETSFLRKHLFKKITTIFPPCLPYTADAVKSGNDLSISMGSANLWQNTNIRFIRDTVLFAQIDIKGNSGPDIVKAYQELDAEIAMMAQKLDEQSLLAVVGENGTVDIEGYIDFASSPLADLLDGEPMALGRSVMFKIKKGQEAKFAKKFKAEFADDFILLSREETVVSKLFGKGENALLEILDKDFLAVSKSPMQLLFNSQKPAKALGGGILEEELYVPFVLYASR